MDEGGEEGKVTTLFLSLHAQLPSLVSRWGSVNTEIKVLSVENPELRNVLPLKPVAGKNIATHVWPTAKNVFLVLISTFPLHSPCFVFVFLRASSYFVTAYDLAWPTE